MISWIQKTFQQHFRVIFLVLLVLLIVSFVFTFGPSSGLNGRNKDHSRPFYGLNLNSTEDQKRLLGDASISIELLGEQIRSEAQFQQYALQRHAAIHLANELNLPAPTDEDLAKHIQALPAFAGADGKFDPKRYADFRDSLKTNPRVKESDITRVLAGDVTRQRVLALLSGPGYVLPGDVKTYLSRVDSTWTLDAVAVDYPSFKPTINVTDADLAKYFEFNASRYEISPRTSVAYLDFPASDYTGQITLTDAEIRDFYNANPSRFPKPATAKVATAPTLLASATTGVDADFLAVRSQVEAALKLERAQHLASAAAADATVALYEGKVTADSIAAFTAAHKFSLKSIPAFNAENVPAELGSDPQVATEALKTGPQHPFSDPVSTGRGSAVLIWKETIPARQPQLTEVKDRVNADYVESEKRKHFAEAGRTLRTALEIRLKAGDTLEKAVAASGSVIPAKLSLKTWPAFSLSKPPADIDYSVYGALDNLQKGQLSEMIITADQGLIVHAADKKLPELDPAGAKFTEARTRLASATAARNGQNYLWTLVEKELAKSAPAEAVR